MASRCISPRTWTLSLASYMLDGGGSSGGKEARRKVGAYTTMAVIID